MISSPRLITVLSTILLILHGTVAQKDESLIRILSKHKGPVLSLAISPDDKIIASGSEDKLIYLWNADNGEVLKTLEGHTGKVQFLEFSPDGKYLLSAGGTQIFLWKIENGTSRAFNWHKTHIWNTRFSPDGTKFLSTDLLNKFRLWDLGSGEIIHTFEGHTKTVLAVAISDDGKYIASGSLDQTIKIWDAETYEVIRSINAHGGNIYSLDFSPDGKLLASASEDETIKLWNVSTGKIFKLLLGHQYAVMYVRFSPDGKFIISASYDKTAKFWEVKSGQCIYTFIDQTDIVNAADFSHDGKYVLTGSNDGNIYQYKLSPRLFAEFYYFDEIKSEMDETRLFEERRKSESKQEYEDRKARADKFRNELYLKYYQKYLEEDKEK